MSGSEAKRSSLTRRGFLKAAGGTAGVLGLSAGACLAANAAEDADSQTSEEYRYNQCRGNCYGGCRLKVKVRDGIAVQVEAAETAMPEKYTRICPKGLSFLHRVYGPSRVKYPLRRVEGTERGAGEWERISWDDALDEIASKWKQYRNESGNSSICFNSASGNLGKGGPQAYTFLRGLLGAASFTANEDAAGISTVALTTGLNGYQTGCSDESHRCAKTVLMMGCNAAVAYLQSFKALQDAQENGAILVHVDPVYSLTSEKADWHVPIRPGSDTALLLAMINVCIQQSWIDEEFLLANTVGPYLVKEDGAYLRASDLGVEPREGELDAAGNPTAIDPIQVWENEFTDCDRAQHPELVGSYTQDGITASTAYELLVRQTSEWTPERAAAICDIPAEDIFKLADLFANHGPSVCFFGFGMDHYNGGHQAYHAAVELMAITGNFGKPGTGFGGGLEYNYSFMLSNPNLVAEDAIPGPTIGKVFAPRVLEEGKAGDIPITVRSTYYYNANYLSNAPERQKALEYFDANDLIVVADANMTETACHADIVLPVTTWLEFSDVTAQGTAPNITYAEKCIEPLYEAKTDYEICQLLADRMGFEGRLAWDYDDYLAAFLDNPLAQMMGITFDDLKREGSLLVFPEGMSYIGDSGYGTATGKVEFYLENMGHIEFLEGMDMGDPIDMTQEHLASFVPPYEAWPESVAEFEANSLAEKYPLVYTSMRNRFRTHTQFFDCDWLLEVIPEPSVRLNPDDAAARGIGEGDYVRVFNERGEVVLKAELNAGIRPGMVVYPKGWQEKDFVKGHTSDLTSIYTNAAKYNSYHFDALCQVERYDYKGE